MLVTLCGVSVRTLSGQSTIKIVENATLRVLILDLSGHIDELESRCSVSTCARVGRSGMEAVRAVTEGSCRVKVIVIEASTVNGEVLGSWSDDTVWRCRFSLRVRVCSLSDDNCVDDLCVAVNDVFREREFDTSQNVIGRLELVELNSTNPFSDGTVSSILV